MTSTASFYSEDKSVINRPLDVAEKKGTEEENLAEVYEIDRCVKWILNGSYSRIALQCPDELMCDAVTVSSLIDKAVPGQVFILGDTSYGSCCVDEVAAQHYSADCLIHYGKSCLSPTNRIPVLYVFSREYIDVQDCVAQCKDSFTCKDSEVILMYDTVFSHAIDEIGTLLREEYEHVVISRLCVPQSGESEGAEDSVQGETITNCGRSFKLPVGRTLDDYTMFYIGQESLTLTNLMMTFNRNQFYSYNPSEKVGRKEGANVNRMLMKRFYLIEKCKDAQIVGIVIGTLGVVDYLQVINRLKLLIKKAGKKSYTFVVGKLNVAKLANFLEIDVFVLVACPENSLLDSSEFYKPVVTPFELEVAFNPDREWTGSCVTDFRQLLPGGSDHVVIPEKIDEQTDVSLITGRIRSLGEREETVATSTSIMVRNQNTAVSELQAESAGEFLSSRSWKGLEQKLGDTPVAKAVEGRKGIAMGYTDEVEDTHP